jgi:UDP-N-acetylglucosamine diphosphorylase / glucose-1-phosphate thymidylyltransferase / UDP-N-acetylgalactosamine diphosphorylase / glucosamine-1-phosphate N-acetyltransferase / galactosamine-1-phosphate N-acetyltransferase
MKVIVPMAGKGSRVAQFGPKPFINIQSRPMVAWALESMRGITYSQLIFVLLSEHENLFRQIEDTGLRKTVCTNSIIVLQQNLLPGQLCSVLEARQLLDTDEDILIASADTFIVSDLSKDISNRHPNCRGLISVAELSGDKWSFARTERHSTRVVEVAEKRRISNYASTGLYYFSSGREFLAVADDVIKSGSTIRGEYYVIGVYQRYIDKGWRVDISIAREAWDMGTPEALERFHERLRNKA